MVAIINGGKDDGNIEYLGFNDNIVLEEKLNNYFKKRKGVCKNG